MIVFVGGFVGSGRERLAQKLATQLGFSLLTLPNAYGYGAILASHRARNPHAPFDDDELHTLYSDLAARLPRLQKMYGGAVVCVGLHRKEPRDILFNVAQSLGEMRVLWIECSDKAAHERMRIHTGGGMWQKTLAQLRVAMQKSYEPLEVPFITFHNESGRGQEANFLMFYSQSFGDS